MFDLLSGNEALARGAWEAGVTFASGYPGTPSTEILESLVTYKEPGLYAEWAPNEKVALEVAAGAALSGARCLVTMKHVGLNVAADPLMTLAYTGVVGGMVIVVADDPGMHSSQNEQDSRHWCRFGKLPMLEPSSSQEACDFVACGLELSEKHRTPVLIRSNTRISHSRGMVQLGSRQVPDRVIGFEKNPKQFVPVPAFARGMRVRLEDRIAGLRQEAETTELNPIEWRDRQLGIVTGSISYEYVREVFPDASTLKLGLSWPYPDDRIREFAAGVEKLLVVEELDDLLEEHIRALGIECVGRELVPGIGELTPNRLEAVKAKLEGQPVPEVNPVPEAADLPARPPVLCAGCPHRGMFAALREFDVVVTGDIGCYALGVQPPLARLDTILCMGAGFSMAHGMQKAGDRRKIVGMLGDSTFFHSGITGMLDMAYNRGASVLIVVDNRTTAMTGHQDHPGTGQTLLGEPTAEVSIEAVAKACGVDRVRTLDPRDLEATVAALKEELEADAPSLIVSRSPCVLADRSVWETPRQIDEQACIACGECVSLGCPAIENRGGYPHIDPTMCTGCSLCEEACYLNLITTPQDEGLAV
ncbi:MAG: indolepyruvate ferredoxin oxidoreductase subunit alpha [Phycisphaeraceae bacterium]